MRTIVAFQSWTVSSSNSNATTLPSGEKAADQTAHGEVSILSAVRDERKDTNEETVKHYIFDYKERGSCGNSYKHLLSDVAA